MKNDSISAIDCEKTDYLVIYFQYPFPCLFYLHTKFSSHSFMMFLMFNAKFKYHEIHSNSRINHSESWCF